MTLPLFSPGDDPGPSFADLLLAFPGKPGDIPERLRKPARAQRDTGL